MLPGFKVRQMGSVRILKPTVVAFEDREGPMSQGTQVTSKLEKARKWVSPPEPLEKLGSADTLMLAQ